MSRLSLFYSIIFLILVLINNQTYSQEWGEISVREWELEAPEEYPQANSIIIFHKCKITTELRGVVAEHHIRMKSFNDTGVSEINNVKIKVGRHDSIDNLKAQIIKKDGSIIKIEKGDINKIEDDNKKVKSFSFTGFKPGDIAEYSYKISYYGGWEKLGPEKYLLFSQMFDYKQYEKREKILDYKYRIFDDDDLYQNISNLPAWYFDDSVYTLESELVVKLGSDLDYAYYSTNLPTEKRKPIYKKGSGFIDRVYKYYSWSLENVIPYNLNNKIDSISSSRKAIYFKLISNRGTNKIYRASYTDDFWKKVGMSFQGYLYEYVKKPRKFRKIVKKITSNCSSQKEKVEAIFNYVKTEIISDNTEGFTLKPMHTNMKKILSKKKCNAFEKNILLTEMLRVSGFEVWPVLISTKDRVSHRISGEFNHLITCVALNEQNVYLDACSNTSSFDFLPQLSSVDEGLLLDYDNSRMVTLIRK